MTEPQRRRLTSWKEIASHMGRDVRTVMRWEKERELPVRRGSGGKSGVVFADIDELDAWTRGDLGASEAPLPVAERLGPAVRPVRRPRLAIAAAGVLALALALGLIGWGLRPSRADEQADTFVMTQEAVVARRADGSQKWRHDFGAERAGVMFGRPGNPVERLGSEGVLVGFSAASRVDTPGIASGQVLWFDPAGTITRSFAFADRLAFGTRVYSDPWSISDYQVEGTGGTRRIAVAGHHHEWWPSIVTVLDDRWQRKGSFVHPGWVEQVRWLPDDRLAVAGFSNLMDGGMVALLDARALDGQSPSPQDSVFHCTACGPDLPVRYVILPRSEVNRVSGAPFNRASLSFRTSVLLVYTLELPQTTTGTPADAFYEFTPQLKLAYASYSDRYWEAHAALERLGKITHTRQHCPERDGPPEIRVWEPKTGWTTELTAPLRVRAHTPIEQ